MQTVSQIEDHLTGMGHGSTLNKVRNAYALYERSASRLMLRMKPMETMRTQALASVIYDDFYNYALPTDFFDLIDLIPQDSRDLWDKAFRNPAGQFDVQKAVRNRTVSIEAQNGAKFIRINWRTRQPKVLNQMNSLTANGAWTGVGGATDVAVDAIFKVSGGGSIVFTHVVSGDGLKNTTMAQLDLTTENGVASVFVPVYFTTVPTSATAVWGNDLTTKFLTSSVTTQADGSPFRVGWNTLRFDWASAVQTGTLTPSQVDSFEITFAGTALGKIRVDNITVSIGRNFDVKYYGKYFFIDKDGSTWKSRPTSGDDFVLVDNDSLPHFLYECLQDMAQQMEGTDGQFDIKYAASQLMDLYPSYRGRYPSQVKKQVAAYGSGPRFGPFGANSNGRGPKF